MRLLTIPLILAALLCAVTGFYAGVMLSYSERGIEIRKNLAAREPVENESDLELAAALTDVHRDVAATNRIVSTIAIGLGLAAASALVALVAYLGRYSEVRERAIRAEEKLEEEIALRYETEAARQTRVGQPANQETQLTPRPP